MCVCAWRHVTRCKCESLWGLWVCMHVWWTVQVCVYVFLVFIYKIEQGKSGWKALKCRVRFGMQPDGVKRKLSELPCRMWDCKLCLFQPCGDSWCGTEFGPWLILSHDFFFICKVFFFIRKFIKFIKECKAKKYYFWVSCACTVLVLILPRWTITSFKTTPNTLGFFSAAFVREPTDQLCFCHLGIQKAPRKWGSLQSHLGTNSSRHGRRLRRVPSFFHKPTDLDSQAYIPGLCPVWTRELHQKCLEIRRAVSPLGSWWLHLTAA